ncbi:MAG: polymer-forming cytoskeletal protein [Deltaproteobacteria bacterium]|nr:polymer-forming cytoskeletal protein [Deltaproteobacteria bacterium]
MAEPSGIIGQGISIRGNVSGTGDLVVEGRVEGQITLADRLTVEDAGSVVADVEAGEVTVNGEMSGNIVASQRVHITANAKVLSDIRAPRVVIEDGARFKGNIEMDVKLPDNI